MSRRFSISKNNKIFFRVKYANALFIIAFAYLILANKLLEQFEVSMLIKFFSLLVFGFIWLKLYLCCVSDIDFGENQIIYTNAVCTRSIPLNKIEKASLYSIKSSSCLIIFIRLEDKTLPKVLALTSPSTNVGNFSDTLKEIQGEILLVKKKV